MIAPAFLDAVSWLAETLAVDPAPAMTFQCVHHVRGQTVAAVFACTGPEDAHRVIEALARLAARDPAVLVVRE